MKYFFAAFARPDRDFMDHCAHVGSSGLQTGQHCAQLVHGPQPPARYTQLAPFFKLHPDIDVKIEPNTYDKIIVQCSSRVGPDLIEIYTNTDMVGFAEAGILLDLTEYAKKMGFSIDVTYPQLRDNLILNGKQYRFPCNVGNQVIFYNKKMFRAAGIPFPDDAMLWEDFIERVEAPHEKAQGRRGLRAIRASAWQRLRGGPPSSIRSNLLHSGWDPLGV